MALKIDVNSFNDLVEGMMKENENLFVSADNNNLAIAKKIPLKSPNLMYYFGPGGICYTRLHQIYGPEHAGKTTLVTIIAADAQREIPKIYPGKDKVIWMDFEKTFDPIHAKAMGLDVSPDKFYLMSPDTGEQGFEKVKKLIKSGAVAMVVLDSDAAMSTESELESDEVGKATYGAQAKLLASVLRSINVLCANYETLYYEISQERPDPTVRSSYGPVKKATGGESIKFYSVTRSRIKKTGNIEDPKTKEIKGITVTLTNIKNKQGGGAIPFRSVELNLMFDGLDSDAEYLDLAEKYAKLGDLKELILTGRTWSVPSRPGLTFSSKDKMREGLKADPSLFDLIKKDIDRFQGQRSTLDNFNVELDEDDDGIEVEDAGEALKKRTDRQKQKAEEAKKLLEEKTKVLEGEPLDLGEDEEASNSTPAEIVEENKTEASIEPKVENAEPKVEEKVEPKKSRRVQVES